VPAVVFERRGVDTVGATVYGPDPRESDLTPAGTGAVRDAIGAEVFDEGRFAAELYAGLGRADVSHVLVALALILAVLELIVALRTR
jgi:hypothetical protein